MTAHHVKYSHHPSGTANLSQTGKVESLSKQSAPYDQLSGPLFILRIQGLQAFKPLESTDLRRPSVMSASFHDDHDAFEVVGGLYPREAILARSATEVLGPVAQSVDSAGRSKTTVFLGPQEHFPPRGLVLTLSATAVPTVGSSGDPFMLMLGGFDSPLSLLTPEADASFLALAYPARRPDELRALLRTIDLVPNPNLQPK